MTAAEERWRCFVAVPIGEDLRTSLEQAVATWRTRPDLAGLRWSEPKQWHVTIAFIGDVAPSWVDRALPMLAAVAANHDSVTLKAGGVGAFPRARAARVAWYGVDDADGALDRLSLDAGQGLGLASEHPLRPHVTLARARSGPVDLRAWVADASAPWGTLIVDRLELMRSRLGSGPAVYETLGSMPLRRTADA
ncbi:MAG: RNA 2',3'-cyclic phosphodiesterase [Chloroflexi bacterium]|nr:RNA 2',3'-cyclic phosphodiesterase [Chloroflexota bacterium]